MNYRRHAPIFQTDFSCASSPLEVTETIHQKHEEDDLLKLAAAGTAVELPFKNNTQSRTANLLSQDMEKARGTNLPIRQRPRRCRLPKKTKKGRLQGQPFFVFLVGMTGFEPAAP
ncbi:MAG: hypothetical protein MUF69_07970 [Desulfobacterota bacterium]|nr:hypothetical protein [Thermodesulfobacteriota bacterium]